MFKKSIIFSVSFFFLFIITTSVIKNNSRNLEKHISKLEKDIKLIEKNLSDAEVEFIYLSNPEKLIEQLNVIHNKKYSNFEHSRLFFSINDFLKEGEKETKLLEKIILDDKN